MIRISFRQSMSAGLLLIVVFLGWAGAHGWFLLEHFARQTRETGELAVQVSTSIQELAERTIDLERSARQYAVLHDRAVLDRFGAQARSALAAAARLDALESRPLGTLPGEWKHTVEMIDAGLHGPAPFAELPALLGRLSAINGELEQRGRRLVERRQAEGLAELDEGRLRFGTLVAASIAAAFLVALAMGWWLSRPIRAIENAIERLGESRFDEPVHVRGPSDLAQVGRRLDWLRLRLSELETERERTLRHVSHELKTPLTALREGVALLQEEIAGPLEGTQREVVDILDANARALQNHIESLLRLNAVSLGARRLHRRPVSLRRLFDDVVQDRELQIQARRLKVLSNPPPASGLLDGDKLRVVLDNLLSNAVDFSPDGGTIRLEGRIEGNRLYVACIDQGPGVAAEDAERIFAPFVQGQRPPPVERQGSGVGLSIVRELLAVMDGEIRLLSAGSPGAHFEIALPWTLAH
ncbi:sensor histidine kinase [Propionivibrio sp.]|jgi:two-component system sensor histidine kinase GlrK|uniref:sensor histidine kinase n=1 Tax=Propionivibrio sp. TaxID=2212460 RepID=UPI0039E6DC26